MLLIRNPSRFYLLTVSVCVPQTFGLLLKVRSKDPLHEVDVWEHLMVTAKIVSNFHIVVSAIQDSDAMYQKLDIGGRS